MNMNSFHGIGRLIRDAELTVKPEKKAVAHFTLAIGRNKEEADFIPCVVFGEYAEAVYKYLTKGKLIAVEGRLRIDSYEQEGEKKYSSKIIVEEIHFLEKKDNNNTEENTEVEE